MNKRALIKEILARLEDELALYHRAALTARADATDEQSKAENKYDTRGLEASYLARGQSRQAAETERTLELFEKLTVRAFEAGEAIDLGALVELETKGTRTFYFLGPGAGGTEIVHGKQEVLVITPSSPLGRQIVGRKQGERLRLTLGGVPQDYRVVSVG
ncbi:MAG: transcription elongation factor GreAB [Verrucomicrobia bacterium]|nr:transcription elongation factor GreAB [Verrucomicrobiota bacterium]